MTLEKLIEKLQSAEKQNEELSMKIAQLEAQIAWFKKHVFGSGKSERMDASQLLFDLEEARQQVAENTRIVAEHERHVRAERKSLEERFENLPVSEVIDIIPEEVKADPELYEEVGQESSFQVEIDPPRLHKVVTVRRKYRHKLDRSRPLVVAPAPARLTETGYAGASLLAWILVCKYLEHQPLYRIEKSSQRWGAQLPRQSMSDWVEKASFYLGSIYRLMESNLLNGGYLQLDETPIRYCDPDHKKGKTQQGWMWVRGRPQGNVVFSWKLSRRHDELSGLLKGYRGVVQSDGYDAYKNYVQEHKECVWVGCWAHARRKFNEALPQHKRECALMLTLISRLYRNEKRYREAALSAQQRREARLKEAPRWLGRIRKVALYCQRKSLPKSALGQAVFYLLAHWECLTEWINHGEVEIDNNLIENAIRPSAIGKKNWLFIGHPGAGDKSAVIYSIVVSCQRHGIDPFAYLKDVLRKLPSMTNQDDLNPLLPNNWKPSIQV